MVRAHRDYSSRAPVAGGKWYGDGGVNASQPEAGHFRHRLRSGSVIGGVRIWHGPPHDPDTGEEMDRGWRWQAEFDGESVEFDQVWPGCTGSPITETEYRALCARREWARQHAPGSSYAEIGKRRDPLATTEVMPF